MKEIKLALEQLMLGLNNDEEKFIINAKPNFDNQLKLIKDFDLDKYLKYQDSNIEYGKLLTIEEFKNIKYENNDLFKNSKNYINGEMVLKNEK